MRFTKLGHSCVRLDKDGAVLVIDPGTFSDAAGALDGATAVMVTHEHPDHLDADAIRAALSNDPGLTLWANSSICAQFGEFGRFTIDASCPLLRSSVLHPEAAECLTLELAAEIAVGEFECERAMPPEDPKRVDGGDDICAHRNNYAECCHHIPQDRWNGDGNHQKYSAHNCSRLSSDQMSSRRFSRPSR